ncbi:MAG: SMP-30/gluconolactonase/LRE family protein, partial [Xanthobacteraceae bacterium]
TVSVCVLGLLGASETAQAADVIVPGNTDFPESMTGIADGTLFFSSFAGGRVFRAAPGAAEAKEWIKQGTNGLSSVLGVLADPKSNTLYGCSDDVRWGGITVPGGDEVTALKLFDLTTGEPKASLPLPASKLFGQTALCNDIVVASDGTAYITDSLSGYILRLKPGSSTLEVWAHDPRWDVKGPQLDGIAILYDGVYANIFEGDGLYRVAMNPDGSAGAITKLQTSRPLYHSDGLRAFNSNKLLMVEGETKGFLDLITVDGDNAKIETIKDGFEGPVSLWQVGGTVYVLDTPLKYMFDPKLKGKGPAFTAFAVKAPQ